MLNLDFEIFNNGVIVFNNSDGILKDFTTKLNNDLDDWVLTKVPIEHAMINDLTEIVKYEYRYRLYVSTVYEFLGFDSFIANNYREYYWEKDLEGNYTECHLP